MRRGRAALALTLMLGSVLAGCSTFDFGAPRQTANNLTQGITGALTPKPDLSVTQMRRYRVGPGDDLAVTLKGSQSILGSATVSADGHATLPRIGITQVLGMTLDEVAALIEQDKAGGVAVTLRAAPAIYVVGAVAQPGAVAYREGLTLGTLLLSAGGATYKTDMRKVWIKPRHARTESEISLDPTLPVLPGDVVRLGERYF